MVYLNKWDDAVIVALGSNLAGVYPSSRALLEAAVARLSETGLAVTHRSRWWRSSAWPDRTAPDYLNGIVVVETRLSPKATMEGLLTLEASFGRERGQPNAPRTLDLDLIAFGRLVMVEKDLILPHPRAFDRRFVMGPLAEVAPNWCDPVDGRSAADLARRAAIGADTRIET